MFEVMFDNLIGLVVDRVTEFYQVNFGDETYDLFKWVSVDEIKYFDKDDYVFIF